MSYQQSIRRSPVVILEEAAMRQAAALDRSLTPIPFPRTPEKIPTTPDGVRRTNNPYSPGKLLPDVAESDEKQMATSLTALSEKTFAPAAQVTSDLSTPETLTTYVIPTPETLERISKMLTSMETVLAAVSHAYETVFLSNAEIQSNSCFEPRDNVVNIVLNPSARPSQTIRGVRLSTKKQENLMSVLLWRLHHDNPEEFGCLFLCANHPNVFWSAMMFFHSTGSTTNVDLDDDIKSIKLSHAFRCMYGARCGIPLCPCQHSSG